MNCDKKIYCLVQDNTKWQFWCVCVCVPYSLLPTELYFGVKFVYPEVTKTWQNLQKPPFRDVLICKSVIYIYTNAENVVWWEGENIQFVKYKNHYVYGESPYRLANHVCECVCVSWLRRAPFWRFVPWDSAAFRNMWKQFLCFTARVHGQKEPRLDCCMSGGLRIRLLWQPWHELCVCVCVCMSSAG